MNASHVDAWLYTISDLPYEVSSITSLLSRIHFIRFSTIFITSFNEESAVFDIIFSPCQKDTLTFFLLQSFNGGRCLYMISVSSPNLRIFGTALRLVKSIRWTDNPHYVMLFVKAEFDNYKVFSVL